MISFELAYLRTDIPHCETFSSPTGTAVGKHNTSNHSCYLKIATVINARSSLLPFLRFVELSCNDSAYLRTDTPYCDTFFLPVGTAVDRHSTSSHVMRTFILKPYLDTHTSTLSQLQILQYSRRHRPFFLHYTCHHTTPLRFMPRTRIR